MLWVETYAATRAARGTATGWRVTKLADPAAVTVTCDGRDFTTWRAVADDAIELETDVDDHVFRIVTGDPAGAPPLVARSTAETRGPERLYVPASPPGGTCCC